LRKRCSWIHDHKPWTAAEEDFLRASRGTMSAKEMAAALPERTRDAVQSRCKQMDLFKRDLRPEKPAPAPALPCKRFWVRSEMDVLRRHHLSGPSYIKKWHLPHRSLDAIGQIISRLRIRHHEQQRLPEIHIPDFTDQQVAA